MTIPKGFEPAFAIVRVDRYDNPLPKTEEELNQFCNWYVSVTRVFWSMEKAEAETNRLNELNAHKGCTYYCKHTRVQDSPESEATDSGPADSNE